MCFLSTLKKSKSSYLNEVPKRELLSKILITLYRQTFIVEMHVEYNGVHRHCIYSRLDFGWSNNKDAHNLKHTRRGLLLL